MACLSCGDARVLRPLDLVSLRSVGLFARERSAERGEHASGVVDTASGNVAVAWAGDDGGQAICCSV
jgi:hypothetical protein